MALTFLLGILAGWGAVLAEDHIESALTSLLDIREGDLSARELRAITLAVVLFLAAILSWILGNGGAVSLTFGALLGVLVPRIKALLRAARMPDYDS